MASKSKSVSNALYTIHVPTHDPHGNRLIDLTQHPEADLNKLRRMIHDAHTEGPHDGHPYRLLKVLAVDNPEVDSHIKNVAAHLGRLSGHQSIFVHKQGQQGHHPWTVGNQAYDGQPASIDLHDIQPNVAPASYMNHP